jgi:hypothetical protein
MLCLWRAGHCTCHAMPCHACMQTGLPMTGLAVAGAQWRLKPEDRHVLQVRPCMHLSPRPVTSNVYKHSVTGSVACLHGLGHRHLGRHAQGGAFYICVHVLLRGCALRIRACSWVPAYLQAHYLPWAARAGTRCADLMCVYYEKHFEVGGMGVGPSRLGLG